MSKTLIQNGERSLKPKARLIKTNDGDLISTPDLDSELIISKL